MEIDQKLLIALVILHVASWLYNLLIAWLAREGYLDGFVSISVVVGVMYTVACVAPWLGSEAVVLLALAFSASGSPMLVGSIARYVRQRRSEHASLITHAKKVNEEE
jgi:hypothetical protein